MWKPIPASERCDDLAPDGVSRCMGPRDHLGSHGTRTHIWDRRGRRQWLLGNRPRRVEQLELPGGAR